MPKIYNALTRREIKKVVLAEIERELDNAGFESEGTTVPLASWEWKLTLRQVDPQGRPGSDIPEKVITSVKEYVEDVPTKVMNALRGGSKRFSTNPPSPTEVRKAEGMPIPEG